MNIEIEIKVMVEKAEFDRVKNKLPAFGSFRIAVNQIDEYYNPPHKDFFAVKPQPVEWLRIRTNDEKNIFEYTRNFDDEKKGQFYANEYETEVLNVQELQDILALLGFKKVIEIDKKREYWDCGDFEVSLDEVKDLGFFIEVEANRLFEDAIKTRKECINFLEKIGVGNFEEKRVKIGYPMLLLEKK